MEVAGDGYGMGLSYLWSRVVWITLISYASISLILDRVTWRVYPASWVH